MSKGLLLFAFNTENLDYYKMAVATAKRANYFLNLPVSIVTDEASISEKYNYTFDNVFCISPDTDNLKHNQIWINKGRYKAFDISPYDETILLDTDYMINSDTLLKTLEFCNDYVCHQSTSYLMYPNSEQEQVSYNSFATLWATLITFKKTEKTKQLFQCMKMIQENYLFYVRLYNMFTSMYRNDYALTIAHRTINGQTENIENYIPWNLLHVNKDTMVYKNNKDTYNTEYTFLIDYPKKNYGIIKDVDFHMMNKNNFMELTDE